MRRGALKWRREGRAQEVAAEGRTRRLRTDPRTAEAVLVALTGWGSESDKRRSREAGPHRAPRWSAPSGGPPG